MKLLYLCPYTVFYYTPANYQYTKLVLCKFIVHTIIGNQLVLFGFDIKNLNSSYYVTFNVDLLNL